MTAPVAEGVQHGESTFEAGDGVKLFERSWTGGPPKAAVILVHGLKDHSARYEELAGDLARRRFAVYAADLRGHAKSGGPRVYVDAFDEYLADLDLVLQRTRDRVPGKPIFLLGHSMGGAIVALFAITRKPDVRGIILSGAGIRVPATISPRTVRLTKRIGRILPRLRVLKTKNSDFSRDPAVVGDMDTDPLIDNRKAPARTASEFVRAMERIQAGAGELTTSLLVLHGTGDRLTNPDGSRELVSKAASKDKTLKLYEGFYHDLVHEPGKERVLRDIVEWLESRAA
ncbi:MAG: lysophospholipase [Methanobacteriota archaeon]|nr:MAG: lysophospholipase [Euryarchaeota archaeon]